MSEAPCGELENDASTYMTINSSRPTESLGNLQDHHVSDIMDATAGEVNMPLTSTIDTEVAASRVFTFNGASTSMSSPSTSFAAQQLLEISKSTMETNDTGFVPVYPKRKRRNVQGHVTNFDLSSLNNNKQNTSQNNYTNYYGILSDLNIESTQDTRTNKDNSNTTPNADSNTGYCPPIFLFNVNVKSLVEQLSRREDKIQFKIINKGNFKSKLYLKDPMVHQEMMRLLKEKNIESYSYTPKQFRSVNLVLRGIHYLTEPSEIKAELDLKVPNTVSEVSKFSTPRSIKENYDTGLFLVKLIPGKNAGDLTGLRYILCQSVVWEKPKEFKKEVQCKRCQRWGHMAKNCARHYTCVKCNGEHGPGECAIPRDNSDIEPYCVNCEKFGHPANWKGCPAYKDYVHRKRELLNAARERKLLTQTSVANVVNRTSVVEEGRTFSSLFNSATIPSGHGREMPPYIREFMRIAKNILEPEKPSLESRVIDFLRNFDKLSKDQVRKDCVSLLSEIQNEYGP